MRFYPDCEQHWAVKSMLISFSFCSLHFDTNEKLENYSLTKSIAPLTGQPLLCLVSLGDAKELQQKNHLAKMWKNWDFFFGFKIGGWQVRQGDRLVALAIPKWSWSKESEEQNAKHDRIFWLKIFLVELFYWAIKISWCPRSGSFLSHRHWLIGCLYGR